MRLQVRQASFISRNIGQPKDDVMQLDYPQDGTTLSKMIMAIKSTNTATQGNLFRVIGQDWKGCFTFNFIKSKSKEAEVTIIILPSSLNIWFQLCARHTDILGHR